MKFLVTIAGRERLLHIQDDRRAFTLDEEEISVDVVEMERGVFSVLLDGRSYEIHVGNGVDGELEVNLRGRRFAVRARDPRRLRRHRGGAGVKGRQSIAAPMSGKVIRLLVAQGDRVEAGQGVVVVEAMKMQNEIRSPKAGAVVEIKVAPGDAVNAGQTLLIVE